MEGGKGEDTQRDAARVRRERLRLLLRLERWMEGPMVFLAFVWLLLLILEFTTSWADHLQSVGNFIWALFILDVVVKFVIAPKKLPFLKSNWLTILALALPALRIFRVFRAFRLFRIARTARGLRLLRVVSSINRGMNSLGRVMQRRGFGYVLAITVIVTLAGAAGMYAFEREQGMQTFSSALWWTAMIVTTMGSEYWPRTPEGRILCFLLALYAFAVFGYVTAALASFFVDRDAATKQGEVAGARIIKELAGEVERLRIEIENMRRQIQSGPVHDSRSGPHEN